MKKWGLAVVGLYCAALVVLAYPLARAAFWPRVDAAKGLDIYVSWGYWVWLTVATAGEALLLLVPIKDAERRLKGRRPLWVPVIVTGFCLMAMVTLMAWSLAMGIWGDNGMGFGLPENSWSAVLAIVVMAALWAGWAVIFHRFTRVDTPADLTRRATAWLLRGSILELLVAVPCHVAVRRRDDCCAPIGTFLGIAAGLSVMLLSFGPGVFLLFTERCRRLRARQAHDACNLA
jgi:hypothetical protein